MSEKRGYVQRFIILAVMVISFSFAQKGALTMGFNVFLPKGMELTVGWYFSDDFAIQVNIGEFEPKKIYFGVGDSIKRGHHFVGLSVIYKPFHEDMYFTLGYKNSHWFGGMTEEDGIHFSKTYYERFIALAVGYEINLYDKFWKSPVGFGTHITFKKISKKNEEPHFRDLIPTLEDTIIINDSFTIEEIMRSPESFSKKIIKRHGKRIEKKENMKIVKPFRFYVSSGIIWYSKSANRN